LVRLIYDRLTGWTHGNWSATWPNSHTAIKASWKFSLKSGDSVAHIEYQFTLVRNGDLVLSIWNLPKWL
jgi:hypothetical protein